MPKAGPLSHSTLIFFSQMDTSTAHASIRLQRYRVQSLPVSTSDHSCRRQQVAVIKKECCLQPTKGPVVARAQQRTPIMTMTITGEC